MHVPIYHLLIVVVWVIAEALLSLLSCAALGLFLIPLIHSPSLSLAVNKGTSKSGTISSVSNGHTEEELS